MYIWRLMVYILGVSYRLMLIYAGLFGNDINVIAMGGRSDCKTDPIKLLYCMDVLCHSILA